MEKKTEKSQIEQIAEVISAIYTPADSMSVADDVRTPMEMTRSLEAEMGVKLFTLNVIEAMRMAGFKREAINGRTYWLVCFA